jgi:FAD/FMN-containing dehydrogenase
MLSRRIFLGVAGSAAGLAVVGFDSSARAWGSDPSCGPLDPVPGLDGELLTDPPSLGAAAIDAGGLEPRTPRAVLKPGSVDDIIKMIRFCRRHRIPVAARGQGHSTFGQALAECGLVIDMSTLANIHSIGPSAAVVDGGVRWRELVLATAAQGLSPPVLTNFVGLSVGGTLSMGGIGSGPNYGAQVDNVQALEVVTGEGVLRTCSRTHNRDLFEAVIAGQGQCAIITRATVDLIAVPPRARWHILTYPTQAAFLGDLRCLLERNELDGIYGQLAPGPEGFVWQINAIKFYAPAQPPDDAHLLRGLSDLAAQRVVQDVAYVEYQLRIDALVDFLRSLGLWDGVMHPWFDVFLGDEALDGYLDDVVPALTPEDVGAFGTVLLFPVRGSTLRQPLLRTPCSRWVYLFDILTAANAPGFDQAYSDRMLARNRRLFEKARRVGGTRYPIGSLRFTPGDWRRHYGREWPQLVRAKRRYDPSEILTPGPGVF